VLLHDILHFYYGGVVLLAVDCGAAQELARFHGGHRRVVTAVGVYRGYLTGASSTLHQNVVIRSQSEGAREAGASASADFHDGPLQVSSAFRCGWKSSAS
jgi:hypothetical protein